MSQNPRPRLERQRITHGWSDGRQESNQHEEPTMTTLQPDAPVRYVGDRHIWGLSRRQTYRVLSVEGHTAIIESRNHARYEVAIADLQPCPKPSPAA